MRKLQLTWRVHSVAISVHSHWTHCKPLPVRSRHTMITKHIDEILALPRVRSLKSWHAGEALCRLLRRAGAADKALKLCQEVVARSHAALWAWRRCGRLLLESGQYQQVPFYRFKTKGGHKAVVVLNSQVQGQSACGQRHETPWDSIKAIFVLLHPSYLLLLQAEKCCKFTPVPQAVVALQTVLRGDAGAADTWEALGAAYQSLGRLTAAIKVWRTPCLHIVADRQ